MNEPPIRPKVRHKKTLYQTKKNDSQKHKSKYKTLTIKIVPVKKPLNKLKAKRKQKPDC